MEGKEPEEGSVGTYRCLLLEQESMFSHYLDDVDSSGILSIRALPSRPGAVCYVRRLSWLAGRLTMDNRDGG